MMSDLSKAIKKARDYSYLFALQFYVVKHGPHYDVVTRVMQQDGIVWPEKKESREDARLSFSVNTTYEELNNEILQRTTLDTTHTYYPKEYS